MSTESGVRPGIPKALQDLTTSNILRVHNAFDQFISIARRNVAVMEWRTSTIHSDARDIMDKMIAFAEHNITTSLDFAQRLTRATNIHDLVALETAYVQSQTRAFAEQTIALAEALYRFHIRLNWRCRGTR